MRNRVGGAESNERREPERRPEQAHTAELGAAVCFAVSTLAAIGLAVVYWRGGNTQAEGALLAVVSGGIGAGIVAVGEDAMPHDEVTEERAERRVARGGGRGLRGRLRGGREGHRPAPAAARDWPPRRSPRWARRSCSPSARSVRDRARASRTTPYANAPISVVTEDGQPVKPSDLASTASSPCGPRATPMRPTRRRCSSTRADQDFEPGRAGEDWTVDDLVAYSKLCTHVGCPVGLYQADAGLLLCPCHQSTFDVLDGARPIFGPAARSLPQLPLGIDDDGEIVARGDFSGPVGPGFWDRDR